VIMSSIQTHRSMSHPSTLPSTEVSLWRLLSGICPRPAIAQVSQFGRVARENPGCPGWAR
jgi:hypothetical protein